MMLLQAKGHQGMTAARSQERNLEELPFSALRRNPLCSHLNREKICFCCSKPPICAVFLYGSPEKLITLPTPFRKQAFLNTTFWNSSYFCQFLRLLVILFYVWLFFSPLGSYCPRLRLKLLFPAHIPSLRCQIFRYLSNPQEDRIESWVSQGLWNGLAASVTQK